MKFVLKMFGFIMEEAGLIQANVGLKYDLPQYTMGCSVHEHTSDDRLGTSFSVI